MRIEEALSQNDWSAPPRHESPHWKRLREVLLSHHPGRPQEQRVIVEALREAESALGALSRLGHLFHLAEGAPPHVNGERVFFSENGDVVKVKSLNDIANIGKGWYPTEEEALRARGMRSQFEGRGGVGTYEVLLLPPPKERSDAIC